MAKIEFKGIDAYADRLGILFKDTQKIITKAVYKGTDVVADEIKKGLQEIPIQEGPNGMPPIGTKEEPLTGVSRRQKGDLIESFGLAPMQNEKGYINTKAGFDGYGSIQTKKYPQGTPNAMLMRSVESGASFRKKHPVIRPAVKKIRKKAEEIMEQTVNEELKKIFK